jgi:hypothetical protein
MHQRPRHAMPLLYVTLQEIIWLVQFGSKLIQEALHFLLFVREIFDFYTCYFTYVS